MTKRKLFLIIADVVLLAVCIIQIAGSSKENAKIFKLNDTPDEIAIAGPKGNFDLVKADDEWIVSDKKYSISEDSISSMLSAVETIKALDKVGTINNEVTAERYELGENKKVTVTFKKAGNVIRTLTIGKSAAAGSQDYITVDESKDVYLASGNLKTTYSKTLDEIRNKSVWKINKDEISSVSIEKDGSKWSVSRTGSGEDTVWSISGADVGLDSSKASDWFNSFAGLTTPVWRNEKEDLGGVKLVSAVIGSNQKTISIDIYEVAPETEDGSTLYYANSSVTPYTFELSNYSVQKFLKNPEDLAK